MDEPVTVLPPAPDVMSVRAYPDGRRTAPRLAGDAGPVAGARGPGRAAARAAARRQRVVGHPHPRRAAPRAVGADPHGGHLAAAQRARGVAGPLAAAARGRRGGAPRCRSGSLLDGRLVGHVMVGNVVREPLLSAYVGYWVDSRVDRQRGDDGGRRARRGPLPRAGGSAPPRGHRPAGERARACGCSPSSGSARRGCFTRYLDVDGEWRDHLCFAITPRTSDPGGLTARLVTEGRRRP